MRRINGYVCVAGVENASYTQEVLFGRCVRNGKKKYENLQTNGINPYDVLSDAIESSYAIEKSNGFIRIAVKNLRMTIAESKKELSKLKKEKSLVVIKLETDLDPRKGIVEWRLLGPRVEGRPDVRPLPGAMIIQNGLTTFDSLDKAIELGKEVNRQGECAFQVASFELGEILRTKG